MTLHNRQYALSLTSDAILDRGDSFSFFESNRIKLGRQVSCGWLLYHRIRRNWVGMCLVDEYHIWPNIVPARVLWMIIIPPYQKQLSKEVTCGRSLYNNIRSNWASNCLADDYHTTISDPIVQVTVLWMIIIQITYQTQLSSHVSCGWFS